MEFALFSLGPLSFLGHATPHQAWHQGECTGLAGTQVHYLTSEPRG